MSKSDPYTTIRLRSSTRDALAKRGAKGSTFDEIIWQLLEPEP